MKKQEIKAFLLEALEKQKNSSNIIIDVHDLALRYVKKTEQEEKREELEKLCYLMAHKVANYVLNLSRNEEGNSGVNPSLRTVNKNGVNTVEIVIPNSQRDAFKQSLNTFSVRNRKYVKLTKLVARRVAPYIPSTYVQKPDFHLQPFNLVPKNEDCTIERIPVTTSDGIALHTVMVVPENKPVFPKEYILHCHGNRSTVPDLLDYFYKLAKDSNTTVVGFDYRGYGLSPGKIMVQDDLYKDAFSVGKKLIDEGATYILLDGVSLGAAVAARTYNLLKDYCNKNNKNVKLTHVNSLSFASIHALLINFIQEFALFEGVKRFFQGNGFVGHKFGHRSKPNLFDKFLGKLFSPLITLILKLTEWDMQPCKEIKKMDENDYLVNNAKGDLVIGYGGSMAYKLSQKKQKTTDNFDSNAADKIVESEPNSNKTALMYTQSTKFFKKYQADKATDTHAATLENLQYFSPLKNQEETAMEKFKDFFESSRVSRVG